MSKVHVVGGNGTIEKMFVDRGWKLTNYPFEADLVQFTGGEDVAPQLYGESLHPKTYSGRARDTKEVYLFTILRRANKPMAGICRGAQFLNVMCGGKLYQHVDKHAIQGTHLMVTPMGESIPVTSTHHQMMRPDYETCSVLGTAKEASFREYMIGDKIIREDSIGADVEAVYYPRDRVICYQPHPEYLDRDHPCQEYYFELLKYIA